MKDRLAPTIPTLGPVLDFLRLLWSVDHALQKTSKRMAATHGVTGPQRLVIRIVGRFPGIPAGQLARILHLHPSTLTGTLRRLEQQRIIARRPDPQDARRSLLGLTERGREIDLAVRGTVEEAIARVLDETAAADLRTVEKVLLNLTDSLEAGRKETE